MQQDLDPATLAVWGGEFTPLALGAAQVPIFNNAPFVFPSTDAWLEVATGRTHGHIYSRNSNPTVGVFEEKLRLMEGGEACIGFASGMAAISSTFLALLAPGKHVVSTKDAYGGTSRLLLEVLPKFGIRVTLAETSDQDALERAIAGGCDMVYLETPTNPTLKVVDVGRAAAVARKAGATVVVDNTLATPINQNPLALGAHLVVHSATKFLGGHDDALGGALVGSRELVRQVLGFRELAGPAMSAQAAYMLLRGMKTLELRVARQNANAMAVARSLQDHRAVASVYYPGLESHHGHVLAKSQMRGFGGVLSFELRGGFEAAKRVLDRLQLVHRGASLGSVNTLAGPPATTSHVECSPEQRAQLGIPEGLVRYSCGIERDTDLIADLQQALAATQAAGMRA